MLNRGASFIWSALSALARLFINRGWLTPVRLPVRVISVGNIQAGGAGKTPLVAAIARQAQERGLYACILCRGYGGERERGGDLILPGPSTPDAALCGDEAALLHELCPDAVIGVGADRVRQFERVLKAGCRVDLVILDDGLQHWKIRKDVEVVALTSARRSKVLFRDWSRAVKCAHLVVWTKGDERPNSQGRPMAHLQYRLKPPTWQASPYWLVTGVADGASVRRVAEAAGYRVKRHLSFPDHARYSQEMVHDLLKDAQTAGARIALTGKDWVKWRSLNVKASEVSVLEPDLEWVEGKEEWNRVLWGE